MVENTDNRIHEPKVLPIISLNSDCTSEAFFANDSKHLRFLVFQQAKPSYLSEIAEEFVQRFKQRHFKIQLPIASESILFKFRTYVK